MAEKKTTILGALFGWMAFWNWFGGWKIKRATSKRMTTPEGIDYAIEQKRQDLADSFARLKSAVGQVKANLLKKENELKDLEEEENGPEGLVSKMEGALAKAQQCELGSEEYLRHEAAYQRFEKRKAQIDARQAKLLAELDEGNRNMERFKRELTALQARREALLQEKGELISDLVSAEATNELYNEINGIITSDEDDYLVQIRENVANKVGEAKVAQELSGTDQRVQDEEYAAAGRSSVAASSFAQLVAARKAGEQTESGEKAPTEADRPEI